MAHELYTRTNQKIFFAGLSLESWRKAEESASMNSQGMVQAEREPACSTFTAPCLGYAMKSPVTTDRPVQMHR